MRLGVGAPTSSTGPLAPRGAWRGGQSKEGAAKQGKARAVRTLAASPRRGGREHRVAALAKG